MSSTGTSQAPGLHAEIMVHYLRGLGVTAETTKAIRDELERKRAEEEEEKQRKAINGQEHSGDVAEGGTENGISVSQEGLDSGSADGDAIVVWGILEGEPTKVHKAYASLVNFVFSSWEFYKAELEAILFPVFVHCYILLVRMNNRPQAVSFMRAWGDSHEARYKDEVAQLRMMTDKQHVATSDYARMVLQHKFRVRMSLVGSKLLNAYLMNADLLLIMHIINTRVMLLLEDREPSTVVQVVRCGPDDAFSTEFRGKVGLSTTPRPIAAVGRSGSRGGSSASSQAAAAAAAAAAANAAESGGLREINWAAGPATEVALLKQSELNAVAPGPYYPLSLSSDGRTPWQHDPSAAGASGGAGAGSVASGGAHTRRGEDLKPGTAAAKRARSSPPPGLGAAAGAGGASAARSLSPTEDLQGTVGQKESSSATMNGASPAPASVLPGSSGASGDKTASAGGTGGGGLGSAADTGHVVPTGSVAAAKARALAGRLAAAAKVTEATATRHGGMHQNQIHLPRKPPPLPDPSENWLHLRLSLRPLDPSLLNDALATADGGARPFVADPLTPHVVMMTYFNSFDTLSCVAPTRDGLKVAAGFTDRCVRTWHTAPMAPCTPLAGEPDSVTSSDSKNAGSMSMSISSLKSLGASGKRPNSAAKRARNGPSPSDFGNADKSDDDLEGEEGAAGGFGLKNSALSGRGDNAKANAVENGRAQPSIAGAGAGAGTGGSSAADGPSVEDGSSGGENHDRWAWEQPLRFAGHDHPVFALAWSPDGRFLMSTGGQGEVRLWDMDRLNNGVPAGYVSYEGHGGAIWDVSFGPAGYYFATAGADQTACFWSLDCAQPLRIFPGHLRVVTCIRIHPNANYVVSGSMDKTVRVWDVGTGDCVRLLSGHAGGITTVAVSSCGRKVAAGSTDNDIRIWDIATGEHLVLLKGHTAAVTCLDFSAEGSALVSGGKDNAVLVWDVTGACRDAREPNDADPAEGKASKPDGSSAGAEADSAAANAGKKADGATADGLSPRARDDSVGQQQHQQHLEAAGDEVEEEVSVGKKRKGRRWFSIDEGPSHPPVHRFSTRHTGVYSVLFNKRNMVVATGVCRNISRGR